MWSWLWCLWGLEQKPSGMLLVSRPRKEVWCIMGLKYLSYLLWLLDEFLLILYTRHYNGKGMVPNVPLFFSWKIRIFGDKDSGKETFASLLTFPPYFFIQSVVYFDLWLHYWNLFIHLFTVNKHLWYLLCASLGNDLERKTRQGPCSHGLQPGQVDRLTWLLSNPPI